MTADNTAKKGRKQILVTALSVLGATLGIGAQEQAVGAETVHLYLKANGTDIKGDTISVQHKQTTSTQYKFFRPNPKGDGTTESLAVKHPIPTTGTQIKGTAPSAKSVKGESPDSKQ